MTELPLTAPERAMVRYVLNLCHKRGGDPAEYLHRYELLRTAHSDQIIRTDTLNHLVDLFRHMSPSDMIGANYTRGEWTALDARYGVVRHLHILAKRAAAGEWPAQKKGD